MADVVLVFDPASEFEVIETIDFEEEVQRPEELRFFTLEEQLLDYFDKVLPKRKNITKFEYKRIAYEVERVRELYTKTITVTDEDYKVDLSRKEINVPWIKPIYSDFRYSKYSFAENWFPFFEYGSRSTPNYYPRMLMALPKPFRTESTEGALISEDSTLVNEDGDNPIRALALYKRTRTKIHDDGSISIERIPIENTNDDIRRRGYFIEDRKVDLPNPLEGHPFLASSGKSKIITTEALIDIFPSVEAILTHAVPTTTDPYGEGVSFMKIYDVSLSQVNWENWKKKFPPVDAITSSPAILSIEFPNDLKEPEPSKSLQDSYVVQFLSGMSPRFWLTLQEDAGTFVIKMLLSKASESGLMPPEPIGEAVAPLPTFPDSTPEECLLTNTFDSFISSGLYRNNKCIPMAYIEQERKSEILKGKKRWSESTEFDILKDYQILLRKFQMKELPAKAPVYEKYKQREPSEHRKEVIAVLNDEERTDADKADAISKLIRDLTATNNVYHDKTDLFVVCSHTLSLLEGDLERSAIDFYNKWTATESGFRVCKYCGEVINSDVFVAQDEFDDQGRVIINYDVLEENIHHGDTTVLSLRNMMRLFILDNAGEAVLYLLLSLLQILPAEDQILPVLQNIRKLTAVLRANKKIPAMDKDRIESILGIAGAVVVLQTHNPFLIPRRSFGSKILKLSGFPRDTDDSEKSPVLDTILNILKTTFEQFPNTFKGPTSVLFRAILRNPKNVKKEAIVYIKQAYTEFKVLFESAKSRYVEPVEEILTNDILFPVVHLDKIEYSIDERIGFEESMIDCKIPKPHIILEGLYPADVVQEMPPLVSNIQPSKFKEFVEEVHTEFGFIRMENKDIAKSVSLGFPKTLKLDKLERFLRGDIDGVAILAVMDRMLDILSKTNFSQEIIAKYRNLSVHLDSRMSASLYRDAAKGIMFELLRDIDKHANKNGLMSELSSAFQKDLTFNMLLLNKIDAEKEFSELRTRERETFKKRLRQMNDTEREATKLLLDIGIAPYIITNEDRELFAREYRLPDPEAEYIVAAAETDENMPEDGYNATRDYIENGDVALNEKGQEMEVDYGDYGDRSVRPYNDYGDMRFQDEDD